MIFIFLVIFIFFLPSSSSLSVFYVLFFYFCCFISCLLLPPHDKGKKTNENQWKVYFVLLFSCILIYSVAFFCFNEKHKITFQGDRGKEESFVRDLQILFLFQKSRSEVYAFQRKIKSLRERRKKKKSNASSIHKQTSSCRLLLF